MIGWLRRCEFVSVNTEHRNRQLLRDNIGDFFVPARCVPVRSTQCAYYDAFRIESPGEQYILFHH